MPILTDTLTWLENLSHLHAALVAGGAVLIGAALLAWGRRFARLLSMHACGLGGYLLASMPIDIPYCPLIARQLALVTIFMAAGFVFDRLLWAALLAAILAVPATLVAAHYYHPIAAIPATMPAQEQAIVMGQVVQSLFTIKPGLMISLAAAIVIVASLTAILLPKTIRILAGSLAGAALLVAGILLYGCYLAPATADLALEQARWVLAAGSLLAVLGVIVQHAALGGKPDQKNQDKDQDPAPSPKPEHATQQNRGQDE